MKQIIKLIVLTVVLLSAVSCQLSVAYAEIPRIINYQGRLTDKQGNPLENTHTIVFRIYDSSTAGNLLWEETHSNVLVEKGVFSIMLGSVNPLNIAFDKPYWLSISVDGETMSERQQITSASYAIRAEEAEKLGGRNSSEYALSSDITSSPTANKAVRLDENAKLPIQASPFKVYDSGWFAVSPGSKYQKIHNLNTTKFIATIFGSNSSDGSLPYTIINGVEQNHVPPNKVCGVMLKNITSTSMDVQTGWTDTGHYANDSGYMTQNPSYIRIILLGLE